MDANCKSLLVILTRPIKQMGKGSIAAMRMGGKKYMKKKWHKRIRGYFKSQTKELL